MKKYFLVIIVILCLIRPMAASAEMFTFSDDSVTPGLVNVDGIITAQASRHLMNGGSLGSRARAMRNRLRVLRREVRLLLRIRMLRLII